MKHEIRHDLEQSLAKRVAEKAVEAYAEKFAQYNFSSKWATDYKMDVSFSVAGKSLNGSMAIGASLYELDLEVPFIFKMFKGKAVAIIEKEVTKWVEKAKAGEFDG